MNVKKILGFLTTFWPVVAGGALVLLAPAVIPASRGGSFLVMLVVAGLTVLTTRFQSGEWPWLGPRYQG